MSLTEPQVGTGGVQPAATKTALPEPVYQLTFFETPNLLLSVVRQIRDLLREPKVTVPRQYYRGEAVLPLTEMRHWFRDLPVQSRALFEKPAPPPIPLTSQPIDLPDI